MPSASRDSVSATESQWQDNRQLLRRRNISLSDMGDMLGVFIFLPWPGSYSYSSISPGRFFAANEVKTLLAHVLVTYDMKFEEGQQAPRTLVINGMRIPGKTNVMFRRRQK